MKTLYEVSSDMRALAGLIGSVADDLERVAQMFSGGPAAAPKGGPAVATPFAPNAAEPKQPFSRSNKLQSAPATEAQKLLIRQLYFSQIPRLLPLPGEETKSLNLKREIARKAGVSIQAVTLIIKQARPSDLSNFLQMQGQR